MINNLNGKWKSSIVSPRVYTGLTPDGCFVKIGDGMAVSAPAFCFFQMAAVLPLVKLIQLGLELCGTYSLPANDEHRERLRIVSERDAGKEPALRPGIDLSKSHVRDKGKDTNPGVAFQGFVSRPALTSVKELKAFTVRMKGTRGQKNASRALRYMADGSASPMETILFMMLTLPYGLGGYRLPVPELNKRIDPGKAVKLSSGKAYLICDLFWSKANLAIEYDSYLHHAGADRIEDDSIRRHDLDVLGIEPVTVTGKQIRDAAMFEKLAKQIAKKTGKRFQYENPKFMKAQRELRRMIGVSSRSA